MNKLLIAKKTHSYVRGHISSLRLWFYVVWQINNLLPPKGRSQGKDLTVPTCLPLTRLCFLDLAFIRPSRELLLTIISRKHANRRTNKSNNKNHNTYNHFLLGY